MQGSNSSISLSLVKQRLLWWEASDLAVITLPSVESAFVSCDCPFLLSLWKRLHGFLAFLYSFDLLDLSECLVDVYFLQLAE